MDRRRDCEVFYSYKFAKKAYRNARNQAVKNVLNNKFNTLSRLFKSGNTKKFWNCIRQCKDSHDITGDISLNTLRDFFEAKFMANRPQSVQALEKEVHQRYESMKFVKMSISPFNPSRVTRFIKKLKPGRAPGPDGISAEHLKYAGNDILPLLLSKLLNCCVQFGHLPSNFTNGLLIPLLKNPAWTQVYPTITGP
jgi:hypothetical protein